MRIEAEAGPPPHDAETEAKLARSRAWRDGYLRWGRTTMRFGFYLLGKPEGATV